MKTKILFIIPTLDAGGAERQVLCLLKYFDRQKFNIHLCVLKKGGIFEKEIPSDVDILYCKNYKNPWITVKKISKYIKSENIIIVNSFLPTANLFIFFLKIYMSNEISFISSQRGIHYRYFNKWTFFEFLSHRAADIVIVNSESVRQNIKSFLKVNQKKIKIINNGISSEYFKLKKNIRRRVEFNLKEDYPVLISIGRFDILKGHQYLVKAVDLLIKRNIKIYLVLVGDGVIKKEIGKNIRLNGLDEFVKIFPKTRDIKKFLEIADFFVLGTLSEGFSNVLMEAMASGLPVITTDIPANRELIKSGFDGFLVKIKSPESFADEIEKLLKDPENIIKTGDRGREKISRFFSVKSMVEKYENLYSDVVKNKDKKNMKILNIILDGRMAGPQIRIAEVAKVLRDNFSIETIVLFPEKNSDNFKYRLDKYGIEWNSEKLHKLSKNIFNMMIYFLLLPVEISKIKKIIIEKEIDIVHCNGSWQWKGVIAGKLAGKKIVWHLNDTKIPFIIRFVFRILAKRVDGLIVAGDKVKEYYIKEFNLNKQLVKIEAPVNINKFDPKKVDTVPAFNKYKGTKIVSICNVNPYKGIEFLIEAAKILNKEFLNIDFIIIGNLFDTQKKYIDSLKKKISDGNIKNFYFHGPAENIPSILKASDIFVCSSIAEASPMSVWEAMAMEKPIVSTDVGSVSDFIQDGENGFIIEITDSKELAEKLAILIENKSLRGMFGKRSRNIAIKNLDLEIIAEKHFEIYRKLNNGKK